MQFFQDTDQIRESLLETMRTSTLLYGDWGGIFILGVNIQSKLSPEI